MRVRLVLIAALLSLTAGPAWACTICHTPEAKGVRHQLLEHDLRRNASALAAPMPLLLAAIWLAAAWPGRQARPEDSA